MRPASLCRKALTFAAIPLCPCNGSVCSVWERRCPRRVAVILGSLSRSLKFYSARRGSEWAARGFAASHRRLLSLGSKTTCKGNSSLSRPFVCCSQKARLRLWVLCAGLWILTFPSRRDMGLSLLAQLPLCPFTHCWCLIPATGTIYYWERSSVGGGAHVGAAGPSCAAARAPVPCLPQHHTWKSEKGEKSPCISSTDAHCSLFLDPVLSVVPLALAEASPWKNASCPLKTLPPTCP